MKVLKLAFTLLIVITTNSLFAQLNVLMSDGAVSTCNGTLFDTGGQGATGYSNNEYHVLTICPDTPGDVITLDWINFALDNTNTATPPGNNIDNITIYDGNSTAATSLGTYTGNQLQGLIVTCTSLNTSGCLTLVFTSNDIGTGTFAATITCSTPCQRPTVVMNAPTVANNPVRICDGDLVNFDGSGSYPAPGFNIVDYIWNWGDGTTDTLTTGTTSHTFSSGPGEYQVNLFVIDDNNCISTNLETILVQVSTTPSFSGTSSDSLLCLGESVCLDGTFSPTTWTAQPVSSLGGATYLPDDVGQCFTATLDFTQFLPGQTLTNVNDLMEICVSMEHSYMGDLVASIYCPNGQSVIMHQQGGGGTNLGDPNQLDDPNLPGVCETYCWSPYATNGTWVDNSQWGPSPNVYTNSSGSTSLTPGTYESLNSLAGLVGCPLNGTWTIEFCDLWGADDGFVCDWTIGFHPSIYPALSSFTPSIGSQCDSSFWSATGPANSIITSTSGDCNQVCMTPTAPGSYDYTYNIVDNHGCAYDTTITVTVDPGPDLFAGNDTTICTGTATQLNAVATGGILPGPSCNYTINMYDTFGDGWNGFSIDVFVNGVNIGNFTFTTGSTSSATFPISDGDLLEFSTNSGTWDSEVSYEIVDCAGNVIFSDGVNFTGGNPIIGNNVFTTNAVNPAPPNYNYNWTPATGLSGTNIPDPTVTISSNQQYIVEVWETGHQLCATTDTINVIIDPSVYAGEDSIITLCFNDPIEDLFLDLGGTPAAGGQWFDPNNAMITNMLDPATGIDGIYYYVVTGTGTCPPDTGFVDVTILQQGDPACGCPLNGSTTVTDVNCFNACDGEVVIVDPNAVEYSFDGINWGPINTMNGLCAGNYEVYSSDPGYGPTCIDTLTFTVIEPTPLELDVTSTHVSCFNACDGTITTVVNGSVAPYTYAWTPALGGVANPTGVCAGIYNLTVTDDHGCTIDTFGIEILQPPLLEIDQVIATNETCFGDCDGNITVLSANAVSYSIDGGSNFQSNPDFGNLCTGSYTITVQDSAGCTTTGSTLIDGPPPVSSLFSVSPQPTTTSNTQLYMTNMSSNAINYYWYFGDMGYLGTSQEFEPSFNFPEVSGSYTICLVAENEFGCTDSTCQDIIINDELIVYVPNAFTPTGDGLNDEFGPVVRGHLPDDYEFMIFDRWGQQIFYSNTPGETWNGSINGIQDNSKLDVYVWRLRVRAAHDNVIHEYRGHVTLLK